MTNRTSVEQAAYEWWRAHRPLQWLESDHIQTPCTNCTSERECTLAKAVAQMVQAELEQSVLGD